MADDHEPWDSGLNSNTESPGCLTMIIILIMAALGEIGRLFQKRNQ